MQDIGLGLAVQGYKARVSCATTLKFAIVLVILALSPLDQQVMMCNECFHRCSRWLS